MLRSLITEIHRGSALIIDPDRYSHTSLPKTNPGLVLIVLVSFLQIDEAYEVKVTVTPKGPQDEISLHTNAPKTLRVSFLPPTPSPPAGNQSQLVENFHLHPHSPARPSASEGRRRVCGKRFRNVSQPCEQLPCSLSFILLALIPRSINTRTQMWGKWEGWGDLRARLLLTYVPGLSEWISLYKYYFTFRHFLIIFNAGKADSDFQTFQDLITVLRFCEGPASNWGYVPTICPVFLR